MRTVTRLVKTCGACPEQYEGELDDGSEVYIRCRWGSGRLDINGESVAWVEYDDNYQGTFDDGDVEKLFKDAGIEIDMSIVKQWQ